METEIYIQNMLLEHIREILAVREANTLEDAGIISYQKGLVVSTKAGTEYQIIIIRSR